MSSNWRLEGRRLLISVPSAVPWVYYSRGAGSGVGSTVFQEPASPACLLRQECQPQPARPLSQIETCSTPGAFLLEISSCSDLSHKAWQGCKGLEANEFRKPAEHQARAGGHAPLPLPA